MNLSLGRVAEEGFTTQGRTKLKSPSVAAPKDSLPFGVSSTRGPLHRREDLARLEVRGASVGVYRFWRDLGFAVGAIAVGSFADFFEIGPALLLTGLLTFASGAMVLVVLKETRMTRDARASSILPPP